MFKFTEFTVSTLADKKYMIVQLWSNSYTFNAQVVNYALWLLFLLIQSKFNAITVKNHVSFNVRSAAILFIGYKKNSLITLNN